MVDFVKVKGIKVMDGQDTTWRRNIAENFNRMSLVHERYRRQTTDGRTMTYSRRVREFTFAKNRFNFSQYNSANDRAFSHC